MILKRIYINQYKVLTDVTVDFDKPISVFIGINGSGKSSILETLALMFSIAYQQTTLKRKTFAPITIRNSYVEYLLRYETKAEEDEMHSRFEIEYIPVKLFINNDGRVELSVNVDREKEKQFYSFILKKYSAEKLLPSRLVIYYAGISNHFQNIYKSTEEFILKQFRQNPVSTKHGYVDNVKMPLFLFDPSDFNLLFAALWGFSFVNRIEKKLFRTLRIGNAGTVITLKVKKTEFDKKEHRIRLEEIDAEVSRRRTVHGSPVAIQDFLIAQYDKERIAKFFGASGRLGSFLTQIMATCANPNTAYNSKIEEYTFIFSLTNWQTLSEEVILNPRTVFELLLMLKYNGLLKDVEVTVVKDNTQMNADHLSEGEKQVIIVTALNEIVGTSNTLFLFDEPDNFLHPSLQDDLIINIEENNSTYEMYQNHYLITTHNPSFLNNLDPTQGELFIFRVGRLHHHSLSWYGRDINDTIHEIMGSDFRPKWAVKEIEKVDILLDSMKIIEAEKAFNELKNKLSGTDIEIIRLQSKLDFIKD